MTMSILTNLNDMLQSLLFVVFVNGLLTPKKSRIFTSLIFILAISCAFLLTMPFRQNIKPILMIFVVMLAINFLYKDKTRRKMIVAGILLVFVLLAEGIAVLLFLLLSNFDFDLMLDFSVQRLIASVLFNMIFVSFSMLANLYINKFHGKVKHYMVIFLTTLPISYIVLVMTLFYHNRNKMSEDVLYYATVGMVLSIVTDIVVFIILNTQKIIMNEEKSAALMNIQHDLDYKYYKLALEESQKANKVKHDVLNQLQTIYSLFLSEDSNQKKAGVEMVDSLRTRLENIRETVYCENHIINIILTLKIKEALAAGIHPTVSVSIPEDIRIEKMDLCSVFGNLLDNAVEACAKVQGERNLEIKAGIKLDYLIIKVTNSFEEIKNDSSGELISLKEDTGEHGLGLKIVSDIVKKYNGNFDYEYKENEFVSIATLLQNDVIS